MNTAVDADDGNAVLRARAKKALQSWMGRLAKIAADGITKNQINRRMDPRRLSQLIIGTLEGALLISRLQKDHQALHDAHQHLDDYLEQSVRAKTNRK
jgi:TetR/AcrR family transcriptional repressor of nem operon